MEPETASFGDWLRRQREMREISLRDIADRTKISLRYLEAMEQNRFDILPAPIFAKGFLREYARYVGLSPDEVVNHYLAAVEQPKKDEEVREARDLRDGREVREVRRDELLRQKPHRPRTVRSWTYSLFLALAVLLLLGAVALLAWYNQNRREDPAASQPPPSIAAPPQTVPVQATPMPAAEEETSKAPLQLVLDFTSDCWVEAVIDGKTRLSELRIQGESLQLEAQQSVSLTLGNAAAVNLQVNGTPYPLSRNEGDVVRDLLIDLEAVRSLKEAR